MRVVGGIWRGRQLSAPAGRGTRPTTERTREAMASMLLSARDLDLSGLRVLDAFAGSGAIGLELLSRGAATCTFVELSRPAAACVRRNLAALGVAADAAHVLCADAFALAARGGLAGSPFDIVVLDPPYALGPGPVTGLVATLAHTGALAADALVLYERAADAGGLDVSAIAGARPLRTRGHGVTACDLVRVGGTP